ncbi:hypothetical protein Lal_00042382 [Lupinus albus]|nr:hypothetical protein Lal_00042382 [Lupinus albus]
MSGKQTELCTPTRDSDSNLEKYDDIGRHIPSAKNHTLVMHALIMRYVNLAAKPMLATFFPYGLHTPNWAVPFELMSGVFVYALGVVRSRPNLIWYIS